MLAVADAPQNFPRGFLVGGGQGLVQVDQMAMGLGDLGVFALGGLLLVFALVDAVRASNAAAGTWLARPSCITLSSCDQPRRLRCK